MIYYYLQKAHISFLRKENNFQRLGWAGAEAYWMCLTIVMITNHIPCLPTGRSFWRSLLSMEDGLKKTVLSAEIHAHPQVMSYPSPQWQRPFWRWLGHIEWRPYYGFVLLFKNLFQIQEDTEMVAFLNQEASDTRNQIWPDLGLEAPMSRLVSNLSYICWCPLVSTCLTLERTSQCLIMLDFAALGFFSSFV